MVRRREVRYPYLHADTGGRWQGILPGPQPSEPADERQHETPGYLPGPGQQHNQGKGIRQYRTGLSICTPLLELGSQGA
ncbi:hypothetical protein [Sphingobacterium mizutaii]|uniref:hypothetical protein n=1 Tax=Sphingobacterium mizutaii TaxID=1010 RepID=UPI001624FEFF|nr:hypothetical protein [Sphingobacterium mizutaii]